jgi:mono/diheme cytochrome c family protein
MVMVSMALGACSLAGDITPPPGLATAQAQGLGLSPTAVPLTVPQRAPDLAAGQAIYADKCAPCHGEAGDGRGPQASTLPNPPTALGEALVAQSAIPEAWFAIVTEGRIESFMPGFASLNDDQRWDVVGYALSLGQAADQVDVGRRLYQRECAECHGELGRGTGDLPDLSASDFLAGRSLLALYGAITEGVGQVMPGYAETLSDDARWALAAYVRTLGLTQSSPVPTASSVPVGEAPTPTGEEIATAIETAVVATVTTESATGQGRITGLVSNGTAGVGVPAGLELTLHGFDGDQEALTVSQPVEAGGAFIFDGLESAEGRVYVVTADYKDVLYASEIGSLPAAGTELELPVMVFEPTQETEAVEVSRLHMVFDFPTDDLVQVVELWLLSNLADRTVYDGETGAIEVALPEGATGLSLDGGTVGDRFELTPDGFRDRRELVPGENTSELVFSYLLPYDGSLELARRSAYPVAATVAMVSGEGPRIEGDGFTDMGLRQVTGASLHSYERGPAQAGDEIALALRGRPSATGGGASALSPIVIGGALLLLALAGAGLIWPSRRRRAPARQQVAPTAVGPDADRILWAIASLDNDFAAGKIDAATHEARRVELLRSLPTDQGGPA